ncbi:MAG: tryptophan 2,3-dioxygenase family protein [Saprospiraceae bacterium]|nr:tryptophan 2,3-dioxygenase family protein [Saprospiraceae bacterium]
MSDKYTTIHYHDYLELDKILNAQHPRSGEGGDAAHEETLFIIIHQVYELWFKQILHEVESVNEMFDNDRIDERNLGIVVQRLDRVREIMKLIIQQIVVLETMTPLDFLDFRGYLFPASGFQSYQFRMLEAMLGLPDEQRITYHGQHYTSVFPDDIKKKLLEAEKNSLFDAVEAWLERTPFLQFEGFRFIEQYKSAVERMIEKEQAAIKESEFLSEKMKSQRLEMLGSTETYFNAILDKEVYDEKREKGELKLSYKACVAALLINLYRDEPLLHLPFKFLNALVDIDELFTTWRYRHAQMVLRMLGKKIGTGGSSGHEYLLKTAFRHQIFTDLHNISTLLIPRSELPDLPDFLVKELGFAFTQRNDGK